MTDIVERLRKLERAGNICREAAEEIERRREMIVSMTESATRAYNEAIEMAAKVAEAAARGPLLEAEAVAMADEIAHKIWALRGKRDEHLS